MSTLENVYAYAIEKYTHNYYVSYIPPVSYLNTITGCNKKIVFMCEKRAGSASSMDLLTPNKFKNLASNDDLNLTGSPLKDECIIDTIDLSMNLELATLTPWSKDEEKYIPMSLSKARSIMCDIDLQSKAEKSVGSLWILCDASDNDKTGLMCLNFDKGLISSGSIRFKETIPTSQLNTMKLLENHFSKIKDTHKVDTKIENLYKVKENISIKLKWGTVGVRPVLTNIKNSDCTLIQRIYLNDNSSVAASYYRQLNILNIIKDDIINFEENMQLDSEPLYRCGSGVSIEQLQENIINIMTELSGYSESDVYENCEIESVIQRAKNRCSIDVTDRLWETMKCCSSYKDLKTAMYFVFQCAAKRNIVNMPANQNCLAEIIREVSQQRLAIPCLTGSEPLELLLEIGLEKLQKDYEYIFTESKICGSTDLFAIQKSYSNNEADDSNLKNVRNTLHQPVKVVNKKSNLAIRQTFFHANNNNLKVDQECNGEMLGFQNSKFNAKETNSKLSKLTQIHLILEHLLSIQINLNLENVYTEICKQLLQKPLVEFDKIAESSYNEIVVSLLTEKVQQHVEKKDPHTRNISMSSSNKFRTVETIYYFATENIFPSNLFTEISTDEKDVLKDNMYLYWDYTNIKARQV